MFLAAVLSSAPVAIQVQSDSAPKEAQCIHIHLKSKKLEFYENDNLIYTFEVRIGKAKTPTPPGEGYIYLKRKHPVFRYLDPGPQQGQKIEFAECASGNIPVDYTKMRSLGLNYTYVDLKSAAIQALRIKQYGERRYSIHSTTCSETIGHAVSNGCMGMQVSDMLILFSRVEVGARFFITKD